MAETLLVPDLTDATCATHARARAGAPGRPTRRRTGRGRVSGGLLRMLEYLADNREVSFRDLPGRRYEQPFDLRATVRDGYGCELHELSREEASAFVDEAREMVLLVDRYGLDYEPEEDDDAE